MPAADLDLITDAVRRAGEIATGFSGKDTRTWDKADGAGPVTEADLAVNAALEESLRGARPGYGWLSEESEDDPARLSCESVFVIDPIDGTRSFIEGSRTWAHSVAVVDRGRVTAGAIYLPLRDKLYTAALGQGAFCNGDPLRVSAQGDLALAEILATKPVMDPKHWHAPPAFQRAHRPSLAYRLGLVAEARFDAMLTLRPSWEWDIAAGALIVTEAGGLCTDRRGAPLLFNNAHPSLDGVIAAGQALHTALGDALTPPA
ncbi:3'(2'),5'-bisphosphate nucleotidase CysQ [uncultured Roseobacter sp.]|uniref:3'(2'),5'-bisphosphate nucleotidase CysQ n=1 Tax=uncultured Roseobacter sp. TaxID=114847 RepID=UPI0026305F28|nr:3'(2'),5'-bisphosphate nucleotidase CysQ [uncultured Roseobacter sp.]